MNVLDVPKPASIPPLHEGTVRNLLALRQATWTGFADLEATHGLLTPSGRLASPRGQDMVRLVLMRCLEELIESTDAELRDHLLEERIDALNYLWILAIFDPSAPSDRLAGAIRDGIDDAFAYRRYESVEFEDLCRTMGPLLETFRNRAWMNHAQHLYFDGWMQMISLLHRLTEVIANPFADWAEFYTLWTAKDAVLQFRLQSRY